MRARLGRAALVACMAAVPCAASAEEPAPPPAQPGCVLIVARAAATEGRGAGVAAAVRFQPATGKTWGVVRWLAGQSSFHLVEQGGAAGAGPHALEAWLTVSEHEGWPQQHLRRVDLSTGRTWGALVAAAEPQEKFGYLSEEDEDEGAEPATWRPGGTWHADAEWTTAGVSVPPSPQGTPQAYVLRTGRGGNENVRGRRDTGESWSIRLGSWRALTDEKPPGAGEFDFLLLGSEQNLPARGDRRTGRAWVAPEESWTQIGEGESPASREHACEFAAYREGERAGLLRWQPVTGRAWIVADRWRALEEPEALPPGPYELRVIDLPQRALLLRLHLRTGAVWLTGDHRAWTRVAAAAGTDGRARFEVREAGYGEKRVVLVFDRVRGGTWVFVEREFRHVAERAPPEGDHDVRPAVTGADGLFAVRLERGSGRWELFGNPPVWSPVAGIPPPAEGGSAPRFEHLALATKERPLAVRITRVTGETWLWDPAAAPFEAQPAVRVAEQHPPPAGEYELLGDVPGGAGVGASVVWFRFERASGRTWTLERLSQGKESVPTWVEVR